MVSRLVLIGGLVAASGLFSSAVHAGGPVGTLTYAPALAVPGLQGVGLLVLAALLGFIALRLLFKHPNRLAAVAVLGLSVTLAGLGGVRVVQDVYATMGPTPLSNPQGGSVEIPTFYQEYINSTAVLLIITGILNPTCPRANSIDATPAPELGNGVPGCFVDQELQPGGTCFTDPCAVN